MKVALVLCGVLALCSAQEEEPGCVDEAGARYEYGEIFPSSCNECACLTGGFIACTEMACPAPREQCYKDWGTPVEAGETWKVGCNDCQCNEDGSVSCTERDCCLYMNRKGRTKRAFDGQSFSDGCNRCTCLKGGNAACTRRACPNKCYYTNWDGASGWSSEGQVLNVMGPNPYGDGDCPKQCKCQVDLLGASLNCTMDNGEPEPCIYF